MRFDYASRDKTARGFAQDDTSYEDQLLPADLYVDTA